MPNARAYEASTLDWTKLRRYARRVAAETRRPQAQAIAYTVTDFRPVSREVVRRTGPLGLFRRTEAVSENQPVERSVAVVGGHWVLDTRYQHIERSRRAPGGRYEETTSEKHVYLLQPDGSLTYVMLWEEEAVNNTHGRRLVFIDRTHHIHEFNEGDVRMFDFERKYTEDPPDRNGMKVRGDRECGRTLQVHAKGVGLSMALKRLL